MRAEIIVASDTHGHSEYLEDLEKAYPHADLFLHCGDVEDDPGQYPKWIFVRGNNDWTSSPESQVVRIGNTRIYMCHSHRLSYYSREEQLVRLAKDHFCQIAVYGHTHIPAVQKLDGVLVVNPGSMLLPRGGHQASYARIVVENSGQMEAQIIYQDEWPFKVTKPKHWFWR